MDWRIDWQLAVATLMVAGCAAYALWPLLPARLRERWRKAAGLAPRSAGGCGGCDGGGCSAPKTAPGGKPADRIIQVVRRPRA